MMVNNNNNNCYYEKKRRKVNFNYREVIRRVIREYERDFIVVLRNFILYFFKEVC